MVDRQTVQGARLLDILSEMADIFAEKADGYEFELMGNVLKAWKWVRELLADEIHKVTVPADDRFREMLMYLQKHYGSEVTLNEVANHVGLSRSECCRYFKKQSGQTITDYLLQYRIHKSMNLLMETELSVAQVAQNCGFSHQSYYTRRFREMTGLTPKQYRAENTMKFNSNL